MPIEPDAIDLEFLAHLFVNPDQALVHQRPHRGVLQTEDGPRTAIFPESAFFRWPGKMGLMKVGKRRLHRYKAHGLLTMLPRRFDHQDDYQLSDEARRRFAAFPEWKRALEEWTVFEAHTAAAMREPEAALH